MSVPVATKVRPNIRRPAPRAQDCLLLPLLRLLSSRTGVMRFHSSTVTDFFCSRCRIDMRCSVRSSSPIRPNPLHTSTSLDSDGRYMKRLRLYTTIAIR